MVKGKENTAPADRFRYERTKSQTLVAQSTKHPAGRAFDVTNKVNVKASILTGRPSANSGPAQPKRNQNPVLTRTYTVVSSKSNTNAVSHLKKQPNTGVPSSDRASVAVTKSNSRFNSSSKATWSCQRKAASVRMSLGPMVKTKTGLIPAVTQPRNSQRQNLTHTSATAADATKSATTTSVANKVRPRTTPSVSQRSPVAQRKTLPTTALKNPVKERSQAGIKVQQQNNTNSKPLLGKNAQPSYQSQLSSGLKSTSTSSKCTAAPIRPEGRVGMSKTNKSAAQPTDRSRKQRLVGEGLKNGQPCKVASQMSSGQTSRCSSRAVGVVMKAAAVDLEGKAKTCKETNDKKGHISAKAPLPQTILIKRTSAPVMSQTVPRPGRTISHTGQATEKKTPKVPVRVIPQTEGKKLTAAQEERM